MRILSIHAWAFGAWSFAPAIVIWMEGPTSYALAAVLALVAVVLNPAFTGMCVTLAGRDTLNNSGRQPVIVIAQILGSTLYFPSLLMVWRYYNSGTMYM